MDYLFETGTPITEGEALAKLAELGLHSLAFDLDLHQDEPLHWHEFDSVSFVISGTGSFADEHGDVTDVGPGCRLEAPAGWLHRNLAGPPYRVVLGARPQLVPFQRRHLVNQACGRREALHPDEPISEAVDSAATPQVRVVGHTPASW